MPFVEEKNQDRMPGPKAFVFSPPMALALPLAVGLQATANGLVGIPKKGDTRGKRSS
jgi:hypothetical protein